MEQDPAFDFESYISNHSGRTKITRALFIAKNSSSSNAAAEARRWALDKLQRETLDHELYVKVARDLGTEPDENWVQSTQQQVKVQAEALENELKAQKANMSKENIRLATMRLGDFYLKAGDMNAALRYYVRTRDYCSNPQHIIDMCLNVIHVHVEQNNFAQISSYIARAEATPNVPNREELRSKLECCRALCALADRDDYLSAANALMNVGPELGNTFNHILSANDIAVYGGLCALASFDREQLRSKVIQNSTFKTYLELEPQIQEMIEAFYASKYTTCLQLLDAFKSNLKLDIYLASHTDKLVAQIRERAMVQYCQPYSSVELNRMATVFMVPVNQLQKELAELISRSNRISARIDSHNKVLQTKKRDQRTVALKRTLETGAEYEKSAKALMLRMKLIKAQLVVK